MIEAVNLTKRYGHKTAVDNISFTVKPGTVTGFLGPNGAGKSTTMRMIMGLDKPTSGTVTVNGHPYALLGDPGVLLFDEPVNGLDPEGVKWVRETCRRLAGEGRTVFISSHLMSEMAQTADQLLVIGRGRILSTGRVDDVIASATTDRVRVASPQATRLAELMAARNLAARPVAPSVLETTDATAAAIGELAAQGGIVLHELTTIHASLEEAYLNLTSDSVEYRTDPAHQDVPQSQNRAA